MSKIVEATGRLRHYAGIAAGSLGLGGDTPKAGPLYAQIGISDPCNHRCVFCWDHPPSERETEPLKHRFGHERPGLMSLDTFREVIDDLHDLGTRRIDMIGRGEPLLNKDAVEMVRYAKQRDMVLQLCTNASRLTSDKADGLVEAGLDRINISMNAGTAENYPNVHVTEKPEDYVRMKANLRHLSDKKLADGVSTPRLRCSFVVNRKNYFEIEEMVRSAHEVGAEEARFEHIVVHDLTEDISLSREQYDDLLERAQQARRVADEVGIDTNLKAFIATVPTYIEEEVVTGPKVPPCYVGYYFSLVLANGTVMPCCQCNKPVDQLEEGKRFSDIWKSQKYDDFRTAAKNLPAPNDALDQCECDKCMLRARNISMHNHTRPWNRIDGGDSEQFFTLSDLIRMRKADPDD